MHIIFYYSKSIIILISTQSAIILSNIDQLKRLASSKHGELSPIIEHYTSQQKEKMLTVVNQKIQHINTILNNNETDKLKNSLASMGYLSGAVGLAYPVFWSLNRLSHNVVRPDFKFFLNVPDFLSNIFYFTVVLGMLSYKSTSFFKESFFYAWRIKHNKQWLEDEKIIYLKIRTALITN